MFFLIAMMDTFQIKMHAHSPTGLFYVSPNNSANASCPSQPCATLSQYLMNMSAISLSNVKLLFLSGRHDLITDFTMQHVHNVTMVGVNHDNLTPAVIFCYSAKAIISFHNSSSITIANLVLENCGGHVPQVWYGRDVVAATYFSTCYCCSVKNVTFMGYGLVVNNLVGESYLDNITVHLHRTTHILPWQRNQGIEVINYKKYLYHSLIHVSKINVVYSSMCNNIEKFCLYDVGIYIDLQPIDCNITLILRDSKFSHVNHVSTQNIFKIVLFPTKSSRIMLSIEDCTFQYNNYAVLHSMLQKPMLKIIISCINVTLFFARCLFYRNQNDSPLISISVYNNYIPLADWCLLPSNVQIKHSNFSRNIGPLVKIQGNSKSKCITHFSIIGPFKIMENSGTGEDIISIYNVNVKVIGKATFSYNSNARNIILFYFCTVTFYEDISFIKNGLMYVGNMENIITLQSDLAYIIITENTSITFLENVYQAVQVKIIVEKYTPYPFCVFQYDSFTSKNVSRALLRKYNKNFLVVTNYCKIKMVHQ